MPICYILHSSKLHRYYVGYTSGAMRDRLLKHNNAQHGNHRFTAKANDWEVYLEIECETAKEAMAIERYIKRMKSRVYIERLKAEPLLLEQVKAKHTSPAADSPD